VPERALRAQGGTHGQREADQVNHGPAAARAEEGRLDAGIGQPDLLKQLARCLPCAAHNAFSLPRRGKGGFSLEVRLAAVLPRDPHPVVDICGRRQASGWHGSPASVEAAAANRD